MSLEPRHERLKQRLDAYAPFNPIPFVPYDDRTTSKRRKGHQWKQKHR